MKIISIIFASVVLICLSASAKAKDSWPEDAKLAYIDRCAENMSLQGIPIKNAKTYCTCAMDGIAAEFTLNEYEQMMKETSNPYSRESNRLYKATTACQDPSPK